MPPARGRWIPSFVSPNRIAYMAASASMKATASVTHSLSVKMAGSASMEGTCATTRLAQVKFTADELLDLDLTPRRLESFRFDVVDTEGNTLGELAVSNDSKPQISNDSSRRIKRDLSSLTIPPRPDIARDLANMYFAEDIDTQLHRIKVFHVLGDGGPDYELPMGLFVFSTDPKRVRTYGDTIEASLDDLSQIFDQKAVESVTFAAGTNVATALQQLYDLVGLSATIDTTTVTLGDPVTMLALKDSPQSTAELLCTLAGFLPPYFDNDGVGICRATPDHVSTTPTLEYGQRSRAYADDIINSSSLLTAPNIWIAEATSATDNAIIGRYALPATDPHSYENIGYYIPEQVDVQGIDTIEAANEAARAAGVSSRKRLRRRHWSSPVDSRHDTFDAVGWDDEIDLELSWEAELIPGGTMTHESVVVEA